MNIIPNHLRACHLQAIIDSSPCGGRDHTSRRARELLEQMRPAHDLHPDNYAIQPAVEVGKDEIK